MFLIGRTSVLIYVVYRLLMINIFFLILITGTSQFFGMPMINKALVISFMFYLSLMSMIKFELKIPRNVRYEILISTFFLSYSFCSFLWGGNLITFLVSIQFPLVVFCLSVSSGSFTYLINENITQFVSRLTIITFFSWLFFSIVAFLLLGRPIWFYDLGVFRLSGALGVSASSILNTFVFICSVYLAYVKRIYVYYIISIVSLFCVFLSGTRISLLACAISICTMVIFSKSQYKKLVLLSGVPIFLYILWEKIISRLFFGGISNASFENINFNGRKYLWELLFNNMKSTGDNIFGMGLGESISLLMEKAQGVGIQPHNDFIRIYHDLGFLGLSLFLLLLLYMITKLLVFIFKYNEKDACDEYVLSLCLMLSLLLVMLTDNAYIYPFFFVPIMTVYFVCVNYSSINNKKVL